jgi:putative transposase
LIIQELGCIPLRFVPPSAAVSLAHVQVNDTVLSPVGEIAKACWLEIPRHFPIVTIETYVVMPNHMHGILTIDGKLFEGNLRGKSPETTELFGKPSPKSIPTIIRSFKAAVTKRASELGLVTNGSVWHRGYFERVLRNTREYVDAANYIRQNPVRWADDEENPDRRPAPTDL